MAKDIIFHGADLYAQRATEYWIKAGIAPVCFTDFDSTLHGTQLTTPHGRTFDVLSLKETIKRYPDYEIIITMQRNSFAFACKELMDLGIPPERILPPPLYPPPPYFTIGNALKSIHIRPDCSVVEVEISEDTHIKLYYNTKEKMTPWPVAGGIVMLGQFEPKESSIMHAILQLLPMNPTIFDIGANVGYYSICFKTWFEQASVHAFEPVLSNYQALMKNVSLNDLKGIFANNFGLFESEKTVEFFMPAALSGAASLKNILGIEDCDKVSVEVTTLDSYVEANDVKQIDFIKCDVEGSELFVYKGGVKSIEKFKPVVISELHRNHSSKFDYHPNDVISLFNDLGYGCYWIDGDTLKPFPEMTSDVRETNFVFLHSEKHLRSDGLEDLIR